MPRSASAPPRPHHAAPRRQPIDGGFGVGERHADELVDQPQRTEVLHQHDEVAHVLGDVAVVGDRHTHGDQVGEFVEECDLAVVHPQHRRREHGGLVEGRQLGDDRLRAVRTVERQPVERAAHPDAHPDLFGGQRLDLEPRDLADPSRGDVVDRRRNGVLSHVSPSVSCRPDG